MASYKNVNITPGTDAEVAAQVQAITNGTAVPARSIPVTPLTPNNSTSVIPLSALQAPLPQLAQTVPAPIATAASGANSYLSTIVADPFTQQLAQNTQTAQSKADSSWEELLRSQLTGQTQSQAESQQYNKYGVDAAQSALNDINNQMTAEDVSTRHRIEKIQANNPLGKSADAISQQVEQVQRESLSRKADLAVVALASQGKVQLATEAANRAVDGIMESQNLRNSFLQSIYERNSELFDKADSREFQAAQEERQTKAANEEYRLRSQFDEKIKQSDPLYQAQVAGQNLQNSKLTRDLSPAQNVAKNAASASSVGNALTAIQTATKQINGFSTGLLGGFARHVGGTQAANLASTIDTVKSSLTFDTLNQLKANSPTGASGLGALSDNEAKLLASQVASLDTAQSPAQLKANLATVQQHYVDYLSTLGYGYDDKTNTIIAP